MQSSKPEPSVAATAESQPPRIYLSPPHMSGRERRYFAEAFDSNWIAPLGPHVDAFEREFAALVGAPHALALASGTAALHLALQLVGVGRGDEVLVSTLTFAASANPVVYLGAQPTFIDSERHSWNMDPALLAETLAARARDGRLPRAVVLVHLYGQSAAIDPIRQACAHYDVPLIEDAAEALGATYKGSAPGVFGRAGIFSFNGNKIITTGGGGMLASEDEALVDRARWLSQQAREPVPHYEHRTLGYNYRMSNILAAIGLGQLSVLPDRVRRRREIEGWYRERLGDLPGVGFMPEAAYGVSNRWLTVMTLDPKLARTTPDALRLALEAEDIEARPVWKPMHLQPVFAGRRCFGGAVSERLFACGLCLPSGSSMGEAELERVAAVIRRTA